MILRDTYAPTNHERLADWYAKAALTGLYRGNAHFRFPKEKKK